MLIKVFNLTDLPTPELEKAKSVNSTLTVWQHIIAPGTFVEVEDTEKVRREIAYYVSLKMVSVDKLPTEYVVKKDRLRRISKG